MITRENVTNDDVSRAFGPEVLTCPDCGHGIDPHGVDPGGPCGVGDESANPCPCLMQPNGIAYLLIEARVREAQGPCTCPPWHPGTDGPEEDCAQHGRSYAYWVEYAGVLEGRISELLCDLTGGLLSKPGYDVPTMVQAVEDYFERTVVAVAWQEGYDAAESKLPGSPRVPNPYREGETDA